MKKYNLYLLTWFDKNGEFHSREFKLRKSAEKFAIRNITEKDLIGHWATIDHVGRTIEEFAF